jgi:hypothetical protein
VRRGLCAGTRAVKRYPGWCGFEISEDRRGPEALPPAVEGEGTPRRLALPEAPVVVRSPSGAAQVGAGDSERIGLAIRQVAHSLGCPSLPVMEAVLTCLLTAMSLLAFLGLRYPVRLPNTHVGAGTDNAPAVASPTSRAVIAARAGCDVALISPGSSTADKDEDGHEHLQLIADEDTRRRPGEALD